MIDAKEKARKSAVKIRELSELAKEFITELNGEPEQFQVEEVITSEKSWTVLVSYFRKYKTPNELQKALGLSGLRIRKRSEIEKDTYEIVTMSDWAPEERVAA